MKPKVWLFYECVEPEWWPANRWDYLQQILSESIDGHHALQHMLNYNMGVVLAVRPQDYGPKLADTIKWLSANRIPVKLWAVLEDNDGYWANVLNMQKTAHWMWIISKFIETMGLHVESVGIDLEYPLQVAHAMDRPWVFIQRLGSFWSKCFGKVASAQQALNTLVKKYPLPAEFYVFQRPLHPFVGGGLHPVTGQRVISMDYSSYFARQQTAVKALRAFSFPASIPALGILGTIPDKTPGRKLGSKLPTHYNAESFTQALRALTETNGGYLPPELYIFALDSGETIRIIKNAIDAVLA